MAAWSHDAGRCGLTVMVLDWAVDADAEEAAQGGRDDHGARPELVAGAAAKGNEEVAAEEFGVGAEVLGPGEVGVLL